MELIKILRHPDVDWIQLSVGGGLLSTVMNLPFHKMWGNS